MIRARFKTNADDYRPVKWPIPHPYWCTGYAGDGSYATVVAYADDEAQVRELWPDAKDIEAEPRDAYVFTDRFPKPDWLADAMTPAIRAGAADEDRIFNAITGFYDHPGRDTFLTLVQTAQEHLSAGMIEEWLFDVIVGNGMAAWHITHLLNQTEETMTTYTVFSSQDSSNARTGRTLAEAATDLLTADGYGYEIRPERDGEGFRLFVSPHSRNSALGGLTMVSSHYFSLKADEESATREIFAEVVMGDWHGMEAMTDEHFALMNEIEAEHKP